MGFPIHVTGGPSSSSMQHFDAELYVGCLTRRTVVLALSTAHGAWLKSLCFAMARQSCEPLAQ